MTRLTGVTIGMFALYLVGCITLSPIFARQDGQEERPSAVSPEDNEAASDPALARARKQLEMLDGIYKGAIVLITTHYVNEDTDVPAGEAFKELFEAAKANGWHEVRLLDATDQPIEEENLPADGFEKAAVEALLEGEATYEQVIEKDGQRYLRAATPIPVVMEKCIMCHDHYADAEEGQAIGAMSYIIPIE